MPKKIAHRPLRDAGLTRRGCLLSIALLSAFLFASGGVAAQTAPERLPADRLDGPPLAEVLILGTYHMGNPGRDIFNMEADDVLAPKRQAEIRELLDVLTRFRPTRIAIEASSSHPKIKQYQDYLAGAYELGRDERDQIGFRLGKELGLPAVHGIDEQNDFPYLPVQNYAKAHGREHELESLMAQVGSMVEGDNEFLKSHSILQMLLRISADEAVRRGLAGYALFAHFGEKYDYAGAELLTEWYRRNMRIHTHLLSIIEPGDRVLVIYGAGHLGLLRQNVELDPTLRLRTLEELAAISKSQAQTARGRNRRAYPARSASAFFRSFSLPRATTMAMRMLKP